MGHRGGYWILQGAGGCYLGVVKSMGNAPEMWQFENWDLTESFYTGNNSDGTK